MFPRRPIASQGGALPLGALVAAEGPFFPCARAILVATAGVAHERRPRAERGATNGRTLPYPSRPPTRRLIHHFAPRVAGRRHGASHGLFACYLLSCPVWQAWRLEGQWVSGRGRRPGGVFAAAAAGHSIIAFPGAISATRLRGRCPPVDRVSPRPARNMPGGAPFPQSSQPRQHGRGSLAKFDPILSGAIAAKLVAGAKDASCPVRSRARV